MYKIRFYCPECADYCFAEQESLTDAINCPIHPSAIIRDFTVIKDCRPVILDEGGANECTVADIREAVNHKSQTDNPHNIIASQVDIDESGETVQSKLETLENLDTKRIFTFNLPTTSIANGESIQLHRFTIPVGKSIKIWGAGLSSEEGTKVSGAKIQIYNETNSQEEYSTNETIITGNPITTLALAEKDVSIKVLNASGLVGDFNSFISITLE